MPEPIKNTRELRDFLLLVMERVKAGTIDVAKATAIGKLAAHVNESLKIEAELRVQLLRLRADNPDLSESVDKELEAIDASALPTKPPMIAPRVGTGANVTSDLMGDPPRGRSALDQKRAAAQ